MEFFGPREVVIVVGILAFIAIILDGVRRMKRNRYEKLQMSSRSLRKNGDTDRHEDHDGLDESQFPSGGSRIVGSRTNDDVGASQEREFNFDRAPKQEISTWITLSLQLPKRSLARAALRIHLATRVLQIYQMALRQYW